jgi:hypothetical protein
VSYILKLGKTRSTQKTFIFNYVRNPLHNYVKETKPAYYITTVGNNNIGSQRSKRFIIVAQYILEAENKQQERA